MSTCNTHNCTITLGPASYSQPEEELMSPAPQMSEPEPEPEPEPEVVIARTPHPLEQTDVMRPVLSFDPETIVARPVLSFEPQTIVARPHPASTWQAAPQIEDVASGQRLLGKGHTGPAVRGVQRMLQNAGYPTKEDGLLGPKTQASILAFQTSVGGAALAERGRVGPETLKALQAKYSAANNEAPQGLAAPVAGRLAEAASVHKDLAGALHGLARSADFRSLSPQRQVDLLTTFGAKAEAGDRQRFLIGLQAAADRGQLSGAWALLEAVRDAALGPPA